MLVVTPSKQADMRFSLHDNAANLWHPIKLQYVLQIKVYRDCSHIYSTTSRPSLSVLFRIILFYRHSCTCFVVHVYTLIDMVSLKDIVSILGVKYYKDSYSESDSYS